MLVPTEVVDEPRSPTSVSDVSLVLVLVLVVVCRR